jgi:hypothetical protein
MRPIQGRLADLGLRELLRLLTSVGTEGTLVLQTPVGGGRLLFKRGFVAGELPGDVARTCLIRSGTFSFTPGGVAVDKDAAPQEEFIARLEAAAGQEQAPSPGEAGSVENPLEELRESLAEIPLPGGAARIAVLATDPRPYRSLMSAWRQRGWDVVLKDRAELPDGPAPGLLVLQPPSFAGRATRFEPFLALARSASFQVPRIPVLWVGAIADPGLRHEVIMAGVDFILPTPASEVGESARWFREELTLVAERLVGRREAESLSEAGAFRDLFLTLHQDATPGEATASLLRFAATFFRRGLLLAVRPDGFESLGGFGLALGSGVKVSRGPLPLEDAVVTREVVELTALPADARASVISALALSALGEGAAVFPMLSAGECVALLLGDGLLEGAGGTRGLAAVLSASGGMLSIS